MSLEKRVGGIMMIFGIIMLFLSLLFMFQISYLIPEFEASLTYQTNLVSQNMNGASNTLNEASISLTTTLNLMNTLSLGFSSVSNSMFNLSNIFEKSTILMQTAKNSEKVIDQNAQDFLVMSKELSRSRDSLSDTVKKVNDLTEKAISFSDQASDLTKTAPKYLDSLKWSLYALFGYLAIINFLFTLVGYHLTTSPGILEK